MFQTGGLHHHLRICLDWHQVTSRINDWNFVKVLQKTILRGHTKWWARSCWNDACYTVLFYCWKSIAPKDTCDWKAMESAISWSCRSVSESLEEFQFPPIEDFCNRVTTLYQEDPGVCWELLTTHPLQRWFHLNHLGDYCTPVLQPAQNQLASAQGFQDRLSVEYFHDRVFVDYQHDEDAAAADDDYLYYHLIFWCNFWGIPFITLPPLWLPPAYTSR